VLGSIRSGACDLRIADHELRHTTRLYDHTDDTISLDEIERTLIQTQFEVKATGDCVWWRIQ